MGQSFDVCKLFPLRSTLMPPSDGLWLPYSISQNLNGKWIGFGCFGYWVFKGRFWRVFMEHGRSLQSMHIIIIVIIIIIVFGGSKPYDTIIMASGDIKCHRNYWLFFFVCVCLFIGYIVSVIFFCLSFFFFCNVLPYIWFIDKCFKKENIKLTNVTALFEL